MRRRASTPSPFGSGTGSLSMEMRSSSSRSTCSRIGLVLQPALLQLGCELPALEEVPEAGESGHLPFECEDLRLHRVRFGAHGRHAACTSSAGAARAAG
jgi:hypothetical protein